MKINEELRSVASAISQQEGFQLYDIHLSGGRKGQRILRVFIDHPSEPISLEDCSRVSQALSLLIDVKDLVAVENYELEVSSPGLERFLKEEWHFKQVIGKKIRLQVEKRNHQKLGSEESKEKRVSQEKKQVDSQAGKKEKRRSKQQGRKEEGKDKKGRENLVVTLLQVKEKEGLVVTVHQDKSRDERRRENQVKNQGKNRGRNQNGNQEKIQSQNENSQDENLQKISFIHFDCIRKAHLIFHERWKKKRLKVQKRSREERKLGGQREMSKLEGKKEKKRNRNEKNVKDVKSKREQKEVQYGR